MSYNENDIYKYKCIHSIINSGTRFMYSSSNEKGHFGIKKIIISESSINNIIIDDGEYGMTQGCFGIIIDDELNIEKIYKSILSDEFKNIIMACS